MSQVSTCLRRSENGYSHWCPGCESMHVLPDGWSFNGDLEAPTFMPSFKHVGWKLKTGPNGRWTGEWETDAQGNAIPTVCHYILTAGILNFCNDSTHPLACKSVPLPALPPDLTDT